METGRQLPKYVIINEDEKSLVGITTGAACQEHYDILSSRFEELSEKIHFRQYNLSDAQDGLASNLSGSIQGKPFEEVSSNVRALIASIQSLNVMNMGQFIEKKDGEYIVWNRKTNDFETLSAIPIRAHDDVFSDHINDVEQISVKYGLGRAFKYDGKATWAHLKDKARGIRISRGRKK